MKILICGMTAVQSSRTLSTRNFSFAGSITSALTDKKTEVVWADPTIELSAKHYDQYDAVLAGIAPVLSLTASKSYGVLALIDTLYGSDKLRLFVDAPEPTKIHASLRSVEKDKSRLVKPLYSLRKEYKEVLKNKKAKEKIFRGADILLSQKWPKTLYPSLPIPQKVSDSPGVPSTMSDSFTGINLDSLHITQQISTRADRQNYWVIDNPKARWCVDVLDHLMYPANAAKEHRTWTDEHVLRHIAGALGVIVGPHDDKLLWWSPRFIQALNTLTPVATEWRIASEIGSAWNHLAAGLEQMSAVDRYEIASAQREQYLNKLDGIDRSISELKKEIGI